MRINSVKCDYCGKVHSGILLPLGWFSLDEEKDEKMKMHFCSIKCLRSWVLNKSMSEYKDNDLPHMKCGEFKVTQEDCERWRSL